MTTILKKARPVLLTEAIVLGIFSILFVRLAIIEPGVHGEHMFWTIRGCLIGPFEMLINPYLAHQSGAPHGATAVCIAVVCPGLMITHFARPNGATVIASVIGTLIWILSGLTGAWAWT